MTRQFIDAPTAERCHAVVTLRDKTTADCGRRAHVGGLCWQHHRQNDYSRGPDISISTARRLARAKWGKRARVFVYEGGNERYPETGAFVVGYFTHLNRHWTPTGGRQWCGLTFRQACERAGLINGGS